MVKSELLSIGYAVAFTTPVHRTVFLIDILFERRLATNKFAIVHRVS